MTSRTLVAIAMLAALTACGRKEQAPAVRVDAPRPAAPQTQAETVPQAAPFRFERRLDCDGTSFHAVANGEGPIRSMTIKPSGLEIDDKPTASCGPPAAIALVERDGRTWHEGTELL